MKNLFESVKIYEIRYYEVALPHKSLRSFNYWSFRKNPNEDVLDEFRSKITGGANL